MSRILSKSGASLADVYDVEGSIAGIDELQSKDVNLVHEMGATIFAERLVGTVQVISGGATAQSLAFNSVFSFVSPGRILALRVAATLASRVADCVVSLAGPVGGTEIPILIWENADGAITSRFSLNGGVVNRDILTPSVPMLVPNLMTGEDRGGTGPFALFLRGNTTAFGAGTVTVDAMVYVAFAELGGVSSKGLPIPSW